MLDKDTDMMSMDDSKLHSYIVWGVNQTRTLSSRYHSQCMYDVECGVVSYIPLI